ncbi:MAG: VOC family protein [Actinomycetota bacterium]
MANIVLGLSEIVLWVSDMDRSLDFYHGILGLSLISPPEVPPRFLGAGEGAGGVPQMVVLVQHPEPGFTFPAEKSRRVLHHLALTADPDRYYELREALTAAGLELRDGVHPVLKGVRTFYVNDPDGNEVEVISPEK